MKRLAFGFLACFALTSCYGNRNSSDAIQQNQQEQILKAATAAVGMPNIKNFRERRLLNQILEMRDQESFTTYTYLWAESTGKWKFFCDSVGYPIPYATQYTNPEKIETINWTSTSHTEVIPQADPNGLFSPASAEGTWVVCKDPNGDGTHPVYVEPKVISSPFKLPEDK